MVIDLMTEVRSAGAKARRTANLKRDLIVLWFDCKSDRTGRATEEILKI